MKPALSSESGQAVAEYLVLLGGLIIGVVVLGLYATKTSSGHNGTFMDVMTGSYQALVEDLTLILNLPF